MEDIFGKLSLELAFSNPRDKPLPKSLSHGERDFEGALWIFLHKHESALPILGDFESRNGLKSPRMGNLGGKRKALCYFSNILLGYFQ
jgi:hypothetical protein